MKNIPLLLILPLVLLSCKNKSGTDHQSALKNHEFNYTDSEEGGFESEDDEAEYKPDLGGGYSASDFDKNESYDFENTGTEKVQHNQDLAVLRFSNTTTSSSSSKFTSTKDASSTNGSSRAKSSSQDIKVEYSDKIIRTAYIGMELDNYALGKKRLMLLAKDHEAYIANENEESNYSRISNSIVLKIPNHRFDEFMNSLDGNFEQFDYKRINSQDVSEEFYDLKARIKTKKEMEIRYLGFLKQAKTVKDLLRIEEQLRKLREEIEAKEGRLKYLSSRVSLSTIHLNIYQTLDFDQPIKPKTGFGSKLVAGLKSGWNVILKLVIGLAYGWPYLLFFGLLGYLAIRILRSKKL